MRRILTATVTAGILLVAGVTYDATLAGAKPAPPPPPACTTGAQIGTGDNAQDLADFTANKTTDPGILPVPDDDTTTYTGGGTFEFGLALNGPSCTTAVYSVMVFRDDSVGTGSGAGQRFSVAGSGTGSSVLITPPGGAAIFADYEAACVHAVATIEVGGKTVALSQLHDVCDDNGGGGRIWG